MRLTEEFVQVPGPGSPIRTAVLRPLGDHAWPGLVLYSDIFQLTDSTLRCARRFASAGFVVAVPEIYPHGDLAGVALAFEDAGKVAGQAAADATPTAAFDADRDAVLTYLAGRSDVTNGLRAVGFCLGGHLAFRAALDARVTATACYYPTGLHDGKLGTDDPGTLAVASTVPGRLLLCFGSADPHTPADARVQILAELTTQGVQAEWHLYDAEHAFMRDEGPRYDPALTDAALAAGVAFLQRG